MICLHGQKNLSDVQCSAIYADYEAMIPDDLDRLYSSRGWDYGMQIGNAALQKKHVVLDVGCGASYFFIFLEKYTGEVFGIDDVENGNFTWIVQPWLESLPRFEAYREARVHFVDGNAARLPFPDNYFDRIFTTSALEHFRDDDDMLCSAEVGRTLRPGGFYLGCVDYNPLTEFPVADNRGIRTYTHDMFIDRIVKPSKLELVGADLVANIPLPDNVDYTASDMFFMLRKE